MLKTSHPYFIIYLKNRIGKWSMNKKKTLTLWSTLWDEDGYTLSNHMLTLEVGTDDIQGRG